MTKADTLFKENIQNILNKGVFSQTHAAKDAPDFNRGGVSLGLFYDITASDFKLINYDPVKPQLSFDLAI